MNKNRMRWLHMLSRCEDVENIGWKDYGGRGISVCDEWHDFQVFNDWCLNNGMAPGLQLDRIDNDGNYCPENCRFVTPQQNIRNRRNTVHLTAFGETKPLYTWPEDDRCVVSGQALSQRIIQGWNPEEAITTPLGNNAGIEIEAFGETKTISDWSRDARCVVPLPTLMGRVIRFDWEPEKAITTPAQNSETRLVEAFGEKKTISEWVMDDRCNVDQTVLTSRIDREWETERAITAKPNETRKGKSPHNAAQLTAFGETKSTSEWLKDDRCVATTNQLIWDRMSRGWSAEKAMSTPPRKMKKQLASN